MAFNTYNPELVYDPASRRGVAGEIAKVTDLETGLPVITYDSSGAERPIITNSQGYISTFYTDEAISQVMVTVRGISLVFLAQETMGKLVRPNWGPILAVTDANEMRGIEWAGDWAIWNHDVLNGPPMDPSLDPLWLVKVRVGNTNAVEQTWEALNGTEHWRRISPTTTTWGAYEVSRWATGKANTARYADLDAVPSGYSQIWTSADATAYKLPFPGVGEIHKYAYGSVQHIFATAFSNGRMRMWATSKAAGADPVWTEIGADPVPAGLQPATSRGYKTVGIPASLGQSAVTSTGQGFDRVFLRMPASAVRARVKIRNINPRFETADSPAMTLNNVSVGPRASGASNATAWTELAATGTTGTSGFVSKWFTVPAEMQGSDVFIGYGWIGSGAVQSTLSSVYTGANAADVLTGTGTRGSTSHGFVSLEVEVPETVPTVAVFGDSISSGVGSTAPVYYSWLDQWAVGKNAIATHWSHSGDTAATWQSISSPKWTIYGDSIAAIDAVLYAMGSNDIFGAIPPTLDALKEITIRNVANMRRMVSPNVYGCTVTPRDAVTGAAEDLRKAYNAWLPESGLFRDVFDMVPAVSPDNETLNPSYTTDGIHFNATGYAAMAAVINRPIVLGA